MPGLNYDCFGNTLVASMVRNAAVSEETFVMWIQSALRSRVKYMWVHMSTHYTRTAQVELVQTSRKTTESFHIVSAWGGGCRYMKWRNPVVFQKKFRGELQYYYRVSGSLYYRVSGSLSIWEKLKLKINIIINTQLLFMSQIISNLRFFQFRQRANSKRSLGIARFLCPRS